MMLLIIASSNQVCGAVVAPSAYTQSGYNVTSFTIFGTTYSHLVGSTASIASSSVTLSLYINGTSPALVAGDASSASSGLDYRTGAGNVDVGSTFQFGQKISTKRIVIGDIGTGDPVTLSLIDGSGAVIGDYSLSLVAANFGSLIAATGYRLINNTTGADGGVANLANSFVSFQLADFNGTTGDVPEATGIKLSGGGGAWDPQLVALATTNRAPVASAKTYGVAQGEAIVIPISNGAKSLAADADGDTLVFSVLGNPDPVDFGAASITGGGASITYTNTSGAVGSVDVFSYVVSDGKGGLATNSISVQISPATGANLVSATAGDGNAYLTYAGIPNQTYALDMAINLDFPINWTEVQVKTALTNGLLHFTNSLSEYPTNNYFRTRYVSP